MSNVVSSSIVVPGAAISTAACTAPSYLVPVANTQLPVRPPAGTMPTPITTIPSQTSIVGNVPPVATSVPVVTTVSVPPVVTAIQATSSTVNTSVVPVANVTAASAAPTVVVKQPQPMKPYTGQTSWKS